MKPVDPLTFKVLFVLMVKNEPSSFLVSGYSSQLCGDPSCAYQVTDARDLKMVKGLSQLPKLTEERTLFLGTGISKLTKPKSQGKRKTIFQWVKRWWGGPSRLYSLCPRLMHPGLGLGLGLGLGKHPICCWLKTFIVSSRTPTQLGKMLSLRCHRT